MNLATTIWLAEEPLIFREPRIVGFIAAMMLLVYVVVVLILFRREKAFLSSAPKPKRVWFIVQDVLLQVSILLVLVPVMIHPDLKGMNSVANLVRLLLVIGFTLLWASALWMVFSRYWYTRALLKEIQVKESQRLLALKEVLEHELAKGEDSDE